MTAPLCEHPANRLIPADTSGAGHAPRRFRCGACGAFVHGQQHVDAYRAHTRKEAIP